MNWPKISDLKSKFKIFGKDKPPYEVTTNVPIKAYTVKIFERKTLVAERVFDEGPGVEDIFDYMYDPAAPWTGLRIRQKTNEGECMVTARIQDVQKIVRTASPEKPTLIEQKNGRRFWVDVKLLPEDQWQGSKAFKFAPPSVEVEATKSGWKVTFTPHQKPCVLTCAVDANGVKDEALPSFPFPGKGTDYESASFTIPYGEFGAVAGGDLRLGVRGAGLEAHLQLPSKGTTKVAPSSFVSAGPAQPHFLTEEYVKEKYDEKRELLRYKK